MNYFRVEVVEGVMEQLDFDLDAKGFDVLEAVYENGGEATTTVVKEYTGIDKNAIVHYRFDKLEENGIMEVGVGEAAGNRTPPKKAMLTGKGEELCRSGFFEEETPTIVERMDRLERRFSAVVEDFHDVADEFERWRMDGDGEEIDVMGLLERLERFERMIANVPEDVLQDVTGLEERVGELEDNQKMKGKYFGGLPGLENRGNGRRRFSARDIYRVFLQQQAQIQQLAGALEGAGIGAENEELLGHDYYLALEGRTVGDVYDPTQEFEEGGDV
jgi:hypothetical protein